MGLCFFGFFFLVGFLLLVVFIFVVVVVDFFYFFWGGGCLFGVFLVGCGFFWLFFQSFLFLFLVHVVQVRDTCSGSTSFISETTLGISMFFVKDCVQHTK